MLNVKQPDVASGVRRPAWNETPAHSCMGASLLSPSLLVNCTLEVWQSPPTSVVNYSWKALRGVDSMRFTCTLCLLGISVSYDRVENLINGLASTECNRFKQDGVACPLNLNHGLLKQLKPWCPGRYRPQPFFNYSTGFVPWHRNKSFSNPKRHCHPSLVLYESYIGT